MWILERYGSRYHLFVFVFNCFYLLRRHLAAGSSGHQASDYIGLRASDDNSDVVIRFALNKKTGVSALCIYNHASITKTPVQLVELVIFKIIAMLLCAPLHHLVSVK